MPEEMGFEAFIRRYWASLPDTWNGSDKANEVMGNYHRILRGQVERFNPDGWVLLECQDMWSSKMGEVTILPFGPNNTFKEPPKFYSPRGLASDQAVPVAILPADKLPETYP